MAGDGYKRKRRRKHYEKKKKTIKKHPNTPLLRHFSSMTANHQRRTAGGRRVEGKREKLDKTFD